MPAAPKKSAIEFIRPEVEAKLPIWKRIRAAIDGEEAIKALGDELLPRPNPTDVSPENSARFDNYLKRAVWYNVSGRTLDGMTGYVFTKKPVVTLPKDLEVVQENVDGTGVTLEQQAKCALGTLLGFGRAGLLVDYPTVDAGKDTTRQQLIDGKIQPTIVLYQPETITNWKVSTIGAKQMIDLIVLRECHTKNVADNPFETVVETQYRAIHRTPEGVQIDIWRMEGEGDQAEYKIATSFQPKDKTGNRLKEITFTFLGSENNDTDVDMPPLLDLVNLNIAHYRNSADHEEACYIVGQPTPWVSGLTEGWVKDVMKGSMQLGSRAIIPLPVNGQAGLLQAAENSMPFEAMKHKELQMMALGAQLVEQKEVQQTATEAGLNHATEVSTLTAASTNIFLGYKQALEHAGLYAGNGEADIKFELSEPLSREVVSPEQANAIMAMWQGGLIDYEEARRCVKKAGLAWKDDDEVKENLTNEGLLTAPEQKVKELEKPPVAGKPGAPAAKPAPAK